MKNKKKKSFKKAMIYRILFVFVLFFCGYIVAIPPSNNINYVSNTNQATSLEAIHMINKYDNSNHTLKVKEVINMKEAKEYGPLSPISFIGQMTAYSPICVGCTGKVSCPPRQDVRNGNIYYNDDFYGKIRILAADPSIPCGSIVKISNLTFSSEPIMGIVLDRGGAIKGNIMDFLVSETDNMDIVGRQHNVNFEIVRWGW